ncbi:hypothetical protein COX08_02260 [Candidatus Beckwithbacteria bacterium CG23_combo_of_CG06-09_8_20_14_all_34_8]|uniref:Excinuclease ABC subunit C n=1 Tax=Candidatus Beckwithbacteria bacterium CG23_combo_of_CG06-09_8_20_14_all_34_8 TaxID=1974497 RepID=A0A2H0B6C8_9BACT|nr:MAG: hypothetical protein COX08_02260 [Candidatus Beckwithbacteria bacterium CG23_combo_of_CG06-09_8_20_14_all_34_8]
MPVLVQKLIDKIHLAPSKPGVYIFKDSTGNVLYIGKAINLKRRLLYYTKNETDLYLKTAKFLKLALKLEWIVVKSDIESMLLEINLIRTLKPKYNFISKDDKRPLLIHITNDPIPRVKTARIEISGTGEYIGPFPSSYKLTYLLKKLRHVFPYCSCSSKRKHACMYVDLGLCPNPFNLNTPAAKQKYTKSINRLKLLLHGKIDSVLNILNKELKIYANKLEYEKAAEIKKQIEAIESLRQQPISISNYFQDASISQQISKSQWHNTQLFFNIDKLIRIEGYDIANTSGTLPTASMVVFENAYPNTSLYRKFRIKNIIGPNDQLMIYDTLKRRFQHKEWDFPQIILIDGGITQTKATLKALGELDINNIKVVGLAKRFERLTLISNDKLVYQSLAMDHPVLTLLRSIRDESHRFTTTYHKKLRSKSILNN